MKNQSDPRKPSAPSGVYTVIGLSLAVREEVSTVPGRLRAAADEAGRTRDHWVTTALQAGHQARERAFRLPADVVSVVSAGQSSFTQRVRRDVVDLREDISRSYEDLTHRGQRAHDQWHAERLLNERADRLTRSVTPGLARAGVSVRDSGRAAAGSVPAQRAKEFGAKVRTNVSKTWAEYLEAVDETGAQGPAQ